MDTIVKGLESAVVTDSKDNALTVGTGVANGTFGEILQGALPGENNNFLVTLPVSCYSSAMFSPTTDTDKITVFPAEKKKSLKLAERILDYLDIQTGGYLVVTSHLIEGKGLASSSADMVATCRAIEHSLACKLPLDVMCDFVREIEPTDGVMYSNFVSFFHRKVQLFKNFGNLSSLEILAIDEGGITDTVEYNNKGTPYTIEEKMQYAVLHNRLSMAFMEGRLDVIGEVSTQSAQMNQRHNPKLFLNDVEKICKKHDGLGVVVTHSGPCLGVLLSREDENYQQKRFKITAELERLCSIVVPFQTVDFKTVNNHFFEYQNVPEGADFHA